MTGNKAYTSGQFAKKAHVTLRTIRYYDRIGLLHPSGHTQAGARRYTDDDFARLQQILLFKYLGFSLEDIREMTIASRDQEFLLSSLDMQKRLLQERIEEMNAVTGAIDSTMEAIRQNRQIDWDSMLRLIHMTAMEHSLKVQYQNATNIQARIRLHREYSVNRKGWFPWIMENMAVRPGMRILEIGCGSGALWKENIDTLPEDLHVVLSDISEGMIHDLQRELQGDARYRSFTFQVFDCSSIPWEDATFDLVVANHVLFYCADPGKVLSECRRVLKRNGRLVASTYGHRHMQEITQLVQAYNSDIVLSADRLYEKFGLENGAAILAPYFRDVALVRYEDAIEIREADPLIAYILSCHGNQNSILLNQYKEFRDYVTRNVKDGFHITKDAGIFVCSGVRQETGQEETKEPGGRDKGTGRREDVPDEPGSP